EDRNSSVRIARRLNPRVQNLGQILRLLTGLVLAHDCHRANKEQRKRSCPRPDQARNGPPTRSEAAVRFSFGVSRDAFAKLVTEEFLIAQDLGSEFLLQERTDLLRVVSLGLGRRQIRQRRFKLNQLPAAQLAIEPGSPF